MTDETFNKVLEYVGLDGCRFLKDNCELLKDNKTYLITTDVWDLKITPIIGPEYYGHKCLVLTNGSDNIVGGVLFYGRYDMQVEVYDEYKGQGYMSAIHKNGIINENIYDSQLCSIDISHIESQDDLDMKLHLLSYTNIVIYNLDSLKVWFDISKASKRNIKSNK